MPIAIAAIEMKKRIKILEPVDGAILNRHYGQVGADGLRITVRVQAPSDAKVTVNGEVGERRGTGGTNGLEEFWCSVTIREHKTQIKARAETAEGVDEDRIVVLYDKNSIKRYRFSTDDNILFLRDIARNARDYRSIFDNPYLGFWREMHRRYGAKFHFNIYYQTEGFTLAEMPEKFKNEWRENSEWLRLTFHALQDQPANPYINAGYDEMERDFILVTEQIIRFAGEEVLSPFTTVHWGEATREGCRALRKNGIVGLVGYFIFRDGKPAVSYYLNEEQTRYMQWNDYWWDRREDIFFIRHDIVLNAWKLEKIVPELDRIACNPRQSEIMELIIHEQYFYPELPRHYQPDARQKVEAGLRWVTENGYKSVFYEEGFLGAPG